MKLTHAIWLAVPLRHPDEDPLNGITGTVTVKWALDRP